MLFYQFLSNVLLHVLSQFSALSHTPELLLSLALSNIIIKFHIIFLHLEDDCANKVPLLLKNEIDDNE